MTTITEGLDRIAAALDANDTSKAKAIVAELKSFWSELGTRTPVVIENTAVAGAPFAVGDWVSKTGEDRPLFGKVRDVYKGFDGEWLINLVVYHADGRRIGRVSDPCGGPRNIEPALEAKLFSVIKRPSFPLFDTDWANRHAAYAEELGVKGAAHAAGEIY